MRALREQRCEMAAGRLAGHSDARWVDLLAKPYALHAHALHHSGSMELQLSFVNDGLQAPCFMSTTTS